MESDSILKPEGAEPVNRSDASIEQKAIRAAEGETPPGGGVKRFVCGAEGCGEEFDTSLDLARHTKAKHPEVGRRKEEARRERIEKREQKEATTPPAGRTDEQIFAEIKMKGPDALANVLRDRLSELLDAPNITAESKTYAIREWDEDPSLHFNFQSLPRMLTDDAGVKPDRSMRIVEKLYTLYAKYAPALGAQAPGFMPTIPLGPAWPSQPQPMQYQAQPGQFGYDPWGRALPPPPGYQDPRLQGPYGQWPPPYGQQPPLSEEKVGKLVEDRLDKKFQEMKDSLAPREGAEQVEMEIPVAYDEDGKPVMSRVKVSPSMVPFMMMARQPTKPAGKSDEAQAMERRMEKMEDDLKEAEKATSEAKLGAIQKDLERTREEMNSRTKEYTDTVRELTRAVETGRSSAVVSGYQSDSFRLLGQGLEKAANIAHERRPVELIIRTLAPEVPIPEGTQPPATTEAALKPLEDAGLVVEH